MKCHSLIKLLTNQKPLERSILTERITIAMATFLPVDTKVLVILQLLCSIRSELACLTATSSLKKVLNDHKDTIASTKDINSMSKLCNSIYYYQILSILSHPRQSLVGNVLYEFRVYPVDPVLTIYTERMSLLQRLVEWLVG
jgi:hypothetical protein